MLSRDVPVQTLPCSSSHCFLLIALLKELVLFSLMCMFKPPKINVDQCLMSYPRDRIVGVYMCTRLCMAKFRCCCSSRQVTTILYFCNSFHALNHSSRLITTERTGNNDTNAASSKAPSTPNTHCKPTLLQCRCPTVSTFDGLARILSKERSNGQTGGRI